MRLIDADALKSKIREQPWKQETKVSLMLDWIYMLIDEASTVSTVQNEALQKENEQLKAENASIRNWNACEERLHNELLESDKRRWELEEELESEKDYREGLEAIIDKQRAQAARMRELLAKAYDEIETYKCLWKSSKPGGCDCPKPTALQDEIEETLAGIDKAIGGKEDV